MDVSTTGQAPPATSFTRRQRRVLGSLIEKAFTTPEYYPLTLKAMTTACNQKSNRDPVTNYSEEEVQEIADELRENGLVAVVHTETWRTERYRHYLRKHYEVSEAGLAIIGELLLRGRQQLGELRGRASRMVPINSLDDLRNELAPLMQAGYVRASGSLDRRGIEVDHTFYQEGTPDWSAPSEDSAGDEESPARASRGGDVSRLADEVARLQQRLEELESRLTALESHSGI
jgi:uncharacterized protein YceH (UPF0502 family)